jgi:origin recognition complex subunit 3
VDPLTLLLQATPSLDTLSNPLSFPFLDAILTRLNSTSDHAETEGTDWSQQTLPRTLTLVDEARSELYHRVRKIRIGFTIIKFVQEFMMQQGYKGSNWDQRPEGTPILDMMIDVLRGKIGSDVKFLGSMVRYLPFLQWHSEFLRLCFFSSQETQARTTQLAFGRIARNFPFYAIGS